MKRLHHTNLRVNDICETIGFYRAFGFEYRGFMDLGYAHVAYLGLADGGGLLELAVGVDVDDSWVTTPGSGHIALTVEDLDVELERLSGVGLFPDMAPFSPGNRDGLVVCFFTDPDGHKLELIQGPFDPPEDPLPIEIEEALGHSR